MAPPAGRCPSPQPHWTPARASTPAGAVLGMQEWKEAAALLLSGYRSDAKGELWRGWMHTYSDKEE